MTTTSHELKREYNRRYRLKLKQECFEAYGGALCLVESCAETDLDKLELHHPSGGGNADRAQKMGDGLRSPGGWKFYLELKKLFWPEGYVVICTHHHDVLHGRLSEDERKRCAPGMDTTRVDTPLGAVLEEAVPF